jgi:hypothetical protein
MWCLTRDSSSFLYILDNLLFLILICLSVAERAFGFGSSRLRPVGFLHHFNDRQAASQKMVLRVPQNRLFRQLSPWHREQFRSPPWLVVLLN